MVNDVKNNIFKQAMFNNIQGVSKKYPEWKMDLLTNISQLQDIFQKKLRMQNKPLSMLVKSPTNFMLPTDKFSIQAIIFVCWKFKI